MSRRLVSSNFILCNNEKPPVHFHACQLGKHVRLSFVSSSIMISSCFDIIHSDVWTSPIPSLSDGTLSRYKARLVANDSTKLEGVDVDKTFSLVVKPGLFLSQKKYAVEILDRAHMVNCNPSRNPINTESKLGSNGDPISDPTLYWSLASSLQYLAFTRPDISYSVKQIWLLTQTQIGWLPYHWTFDFSAVYLSRNSVQHQRTEHIEIDIHFVWDLVAAVQKKYAVEILDRAHMVNCNPSRNPINTESKLGSNGDPISDPTLYWSLASSLQYLAFTRPDISYSVKQVCLYLHDLRKPYFLAFKRILRRRLAGCLTTGRSTSEAEYRGVANAVAGTCWLRNLLHELHTPLSFATLVYCDNVSAVYLSRNSVQHQRTEHIEIDIHFVWDLVAAVQVRVLHVPSRYQFMDIFTKGLPSALFEEFRTSLSVWCPPASTARKC
nr:ribonuclease H-like domain-containing protein [Tanacetum cinerariifolium]